MKKITGFGVALALASVAVAAHGAVQLQYSIDGRPTPVAWNAGAFPLTIVLDETSGAGAQQAVLGDSLAFWSSVPDSRVSFRTRSEAGATPGQDGRNLVTLSDDLMENSGFIAYTTSWFDDQGVIQESDIQIDSSAVQQGSVEALLQHELGHLLGFDHNANLGSVMYPFVAGESDLAEVDRIGLVALYPSSGVSDRITISGSVQANAGPLLGSHVVAVNAKGVAISSTISDSQGKFTFRALPPGEYRLYAEPLDGPVEPRNLDGVYRGAKTDFRTTFALDAGGKSGDIVIQVDELPAALNPRWIGAFATGDAPRLESNAAMVRPGSVIDIAVGGDGIIGGLAEFSIESAQFERVSDFRFGANYMWATFRVSEDAVPGPVVVLVRSGNEAATLTGGVVVAPGAKDSTPRRRGARPSR